MGQANVIAKLPDGNLDGVIKALKQPAAFMCSEYDPTACHRHRLFLALERTGLRGYDL